MTFKKSWKSIGAAALALAAVSSVSVMAFAQDAKAVPMTKLVISESSKAVPMTEIRKITLKDSGLSVDMTKSIPATEMQAATIDFRTNEKTGKDEISTDGGKTWVLYDGKAAACTPATAVEKPGK